MVRYPRFGMYDRAMRRSTRVQTLRVYRKARQLARQSAKPPKPVTPQKPAVKPTPSTSRTLRSSTNSTSVPENTRRKRRRTRSDPWATKRISKKDKKDRPPPPTHSTCRICAEELPLAEFIKYVSPRSAHRYATEVPYACMAHLARNPYRKNHEPVCRSCIGASMAAKTDLVGARKVSVGCLEPGCIQNWPFDAIMRFYPGGELLEKYNLDMFDAYVADATFFTCPECNTQGLATQVDTMGYPNIQCFNSDCEKRFCVVCNVPWHENLTCTEYAARNVDANMSDPERTTLDLMQSKDGKRCPNCYLVIEKDGGCDSMFCEGCKKHFNWATAASAVLGAKKALPMVNGWAVSTACEMDGVERAQAATQGQTTAN